jgi:hypothetical protein
MEEQDNADLKVGATKAVESRGPSVDRPRSKSSSKVPCQKLENSFRIRG